MRAVALRLGLLLFGLWMHYVLVANATLASGLLPGRVLGPSELILVDYGRAWTIVPGVVNVTDVHIRAQDTYIQWTLDVARARFRVAPLPLLRRVAHLDDVQGSGVVFRIRLKGDPLDAMPEQTRLLPGIPGYADPPLRDAAPATPPDPSDEVWTVQLARVTARVREIWVQEVRFVGDARLTSPGAGMSLTLGGHELSLRRTRLDVRSGAVRLGATDVVTRRLHGRLEALVDRLDLGVPHGPRILDFVTGRARLRGDLVRLAAFDFALRELPAVHVRGGEGDFDVALSLRHGALGPGTHVVASARALAVSLGGLTLRTNAEGRLAVDDPREGVLAVRLDQVRVSPRGSAGALLSSERVAVGARLRHLDVASGFDDTVVSIAVPHARAPDIAALATAMPSTVELAAGDVRLHDLRATFDTRRGAGTASGRLEAAHVVAVLDGTMVRGSLRAVLHAGSVALCPAGARGTGFVEIEDVRVGRGSVGAPLSGRLDASSLEIDRAGASTPVTFRLHDADAVAAAILARIHGPLPAFVTDLLDHRNVRGRAEVVARPGALALDAVDLRGDNYRLRGRLRLGRGLPRARALVETGPLAVGVGVSRGDTEVVVFGSTRWFHHGH